MHLSTDLYTSQQISELEEIAVEETELSIETLMAKAGASAFAALKERWPFARKVTVMCGTGNNGGDGYVLAHLAHQQGFEVKIWQVGVQDSKKTSAVTAANACRAAGIPINNYNPSTILEDTDIVVDALLGTGMRSSLRDPFPAAISAINRVGGHILSMDVPSGLNADTGSAIGDNVVTATITITFIGIKQGLLTGQGPVFCGQLICADLDIPPSVFAQVKPSAERLSFKKLRQLLVPRPRNANKGYFGHVLVIGGDKGMAGAVRMAGEAALRVGAGLVSVATRPHHVAVVSTARPELMCHGISTAEELDDLMEQATVIIIGPGLGQSTWSREIFTRVMANTHVPLVVDADGLNLLAQSEVQKRPNWILTPHPGEAARLLPESSVAAIQADRFASVTTLQKHWGGVVVLKGAGSLIFGTAEQMALCNAGNPGMASAGMGDLLSGIIGGLLAQGLPVEAAARLGVRLHAKAGDIAAIAGGERGLLAMDLMLFLRRLVNPELSC